jgi:ubiquitin-hydrolase Zn-finger-containing protein
VGCCESQRAHDKQHWREPGHPIIRSHPLGDRSFTWCYACNDYLYTSS